MPNPDILKKGPKNEVASKILGGNPSGLKLGNETI
jgi:hypothetical protein